MNYQLVIQFPEELYGCLDWIAAIENKIDESLVDAALDGHDIGSGEVNIFIDAHEPINSFEVIKRLLQEQHIALEHIKAGYREFSCEQYIAIWPQDLVEFNII